MIGYNRSLTEEEAATLLAALEFWQEHTDDDYKQTDPIATRDGTLSPLTYKELDDLRTFIVMSQLEEKDVNDLVVATRAIGGYVSPGDIGIIQHVRGDSFDVRINGMSVAYIKTCFRKLRDNEIKKILFHEVKRRLNNKEAFPINLRILKTESPLGCNCGWEGTVEDLVAHAFGDLCPDCRSMILPP